MIPFAPFAPDLANTNPAVSPVATNVVVNADSFGPWPQLATYSDALSADCRGGIMARKKNGDFSVFAFTKTGAYRINTSLGWEDVTNTGGAYTGPADGDNWSFTQFGTKVHATNINDALQVFDVESASDFSDESGSPPQAKHIWRAGGFLNLGHLSSAPNKVRWCALENTTEWTIGEQGADEQEFPGGGHILGAVGDERGALVFSQDAIRRQQFLPGSEWTFAFQDIEPEGRGLVAPQSLIQNGNRGAYLDETGFYAYSANGIFPIGAQKVTDTFLAGVDLSRLNEVQGVLDPSNFYYVWAAPSPNAASGCLDQLWIFNWYLAEIGHPSPWSFAETNIQCLLTAATPGYTLEDLDTLGYTLETLPFSLDSRVWQGGRPVLAAIDADRKLSFFSGSNAEATIETADLALSNGGRRSFVRGFRPDTDASTFFGRVGVRETFGGAITWKDEQSANVTGMIPARTSGRTARFQWRCPAGVEWNYAKEIKDIEMRAAGKR